MPRRARPQQPTFRCRRHVHMLHMARPHSLLSAVRRCSAELVGFLCPDYCAACDAPVKPGHVFCETCGPLVPAPHSAIPNTRVAGAYAPPLSTAISRMKFGQRADLASRLAVLLLTDAVPADAIVAPVPLHLTRLCARGFNPAALLAVRFARRAGASCFPRLLERTRATPQQSRSSARERRANVDGAFAVRARQVRAAAGRHVVLVDDVVTTGATAEACSRALYAAGVVHVSVIALAATAAPRDP